jgi:hypothetical protein
MAQRSSGERVLGPYPIGKQWRVVLVGRGAKEIGHFFQKKKVSNSVELNGIEPSAS